jgi:hypothetical protein
VSNFGPECEKIATQAETEVSNCDRTLLAKCKADLHKMLKHLIDLHALRRVDQHAGNQVRSGQGPVC